MPEVCSCKNASKKSEILMNASGGRSRVQGLRGHSSSRWMLLLCS